MGGKWLYLHSGDHPWAQKRMAMPGFCVRRMTCKIHPTCEDLSCMQTSDSFLQHIGEQQYHGPVIIHKEVTKLKGILGLQLAYELVFIN